MAELDWDSLGEQLATHLSQHEPCSDSERKQKRTDRHQRRRQRKQQAGQMVGGDSPVVGGFFNTTLSVAPFLNLLAGKEFNLGSAAKVSFPQVFQVEFGPEHELKFVGDRPKAEINKFISLTVELEGILISLDEIVVMISKFPDFTVNLTWQ